MLERFWRKKFIEASSNEILQKPLLLALIRIALGNLSNGPSKTFVFISLAQTFTFSIKCSLKSAS